MIKSMKKSGHPLGCPDHLFCKKKLLLKAFLNSNSQVNGHTKHGSVAGTKET